VSWTVVVNGDRALGQLLFALHIKRRRSALEMCLLHRGHDGGMAGTEFRPDLRAGSHSIVHVVTAPPLSPCGSTHVYTVLSLLRTVFATNDSLLEKSSPML
jgi:hypothetical protein